MFWIFINIFLGFALLIAPTTSGQAQSNDIENRFIYSDYSKKISMDFNEASLSDVLKIFSKEMGKNFMAAQDVSAKKITVFLDNVPVEEALDRILDTNDLTYEMLPNSDVFIVKSKALAKTITRVYTLKFASVSTSKLKTTTSAINTVIQGVISKDGKMQEDARTNSLIITDNPEQFPYIEDAISKLDVPVLQILIEVEMLDVSKSSADTVGIAYGNGGSFVKVTGAQRASFFPFNEHLVEQKLLSHGNTDPITMWTYPTNGYDFSGMTAALDFLRGQSDSKSLARPRILTLNNETAKIQIMTDEAIAANQVTTSSSTNGTGTTTTTAERHNTGVSLEVTPQANESTGEIIMKVVPKVSDANQKTTFGDITFYNPEERSLESILKIKDGETVVLGGLLRNQNSTEISKLPLLGDLPLIGAAFRHSKKTQSERELIIFITPHIISDNFKKKVDDKKKVRIDREFDAIDRNKK